MGLKGSLGSFSAKLGGDRQQFKDILFLKWRSNIVTFSRVLSRFFSTRHLLPNHISREANNLLVVCLMWDISFADTGCCWVASEAVQVSMRHCPFQLSSMSPWLSWDSICFQSLEAIRTVSNMKGQILLRAWKSWKIYWLPLQWAIFLLVAFLGGRDNGVCEVFKPFVPREAEGDSQELHTTDWDTWAVWPTKAQLCLCGPAQDPGTFGTDSHRRVFLPQNHHE